MNCETIDSIIDDHLVTRLSSAERQQAAEHVGRCARCSAAWAADEVLRGEVIADPPPELFPSLARGVAIVPVRRHAARSRWLWAAGAAAAIAVVAVAARFGAVGSIAGSMNTVSLDVVSSARPPTGAVVGRDYEVLPGATARPAVAASGQIEVTEFFMFWCFHCYSFESELDRWEAQAPSDVLVTRVPAMFNPDAQLQARAYYTAEVLGKLDVMQDAFYEEIHERGNPLSSRMALADFFRRFGIDAATFDATFDSSEVDARMQRAAALAREFRIEATPTLVVGGRYSTNPTLAGAGSREKPQAMLAVVDQLVADIRACHDRCIESARER